MPKVDCVAPRRQKGKPAPTLAAVLRSETGLPWSRVQALCERGKVSVDGEICLAPATRVRAGARIEVDERRAAPRPNVVPILFEDAHVVVIDKPAGISSVPYEKREAGTAMDAVRDAWRVTGRAATEQALHVVHRIDKDTSGLIAFAKSKLAERAMQKLFRAHDVQRTYLCVAHGQVADRRVESRLIEDRGDGLRGSARTPGRGKRAVTHVRAVELLPDTTLCEVRLETGKTHQIRIHLAELGHPLVGERVYIRDHLRRVGEPIASPRLLLHAATLGFRHPVTGEPVRLESPLPPEFLQMIERLRARPAAEAPPPAPRSRASAPGSRGRTGAARPRPRR